MSKSGMNAIKYKNLKWLASSQSWAISPKKPAVLAIDKTAKAPTTGTAGLVERGQRGSAPRDVVARNANLGRGGASAQAESKPDPAL